MRRPGTYRILTALALGLTACAAAADDAATAIGGGLGGAGGAAIGQAIGGKSGAVVGGATGSVFGKSIDSGTGSATGAGSAPQGDKGSVTVVPGVQPRTVVTFRVSQDDDYCSNKPRHWIHPGKGYAKGHYKKNC